MWPRHLTQGGGKASENGCKDRKIHHRFRFSIQKRFYAKAYVIEFGIMLSKEN